MTKVIPEQIIKLERGPQFIRVCQTPENKTSILDNPGDTFVLDDPDDEPKPEWSVCAYEQMATPQQDIIGRIYAPCQPQPFDKEMRDPYLWAQWCTWHKCQPRTSV